MTHPCAGCRLRFRTSGELADHIRDEHVEHPVPVPAGAHRVPSSLTRADYTRSGWAVPDAAGL